MSYDPIPFLDLVAPHAKIKEQLLDVLTEAISSGHFVGGAAVERFEKDFASFCGTSYCVGVSSGTDALRFALMATIPPGTVVVTVPNTFIATTEAISQAGAIPCFIDIDRQTYNMNPADLERFLTKDCFTDEHNGGRTIHRASNKPVSAIVPVHLYGQSADMDSLQEIAAKYKLAVIEDACQAHGAEYFSRKQNKWRASGTLSRAAAFSFYPGKNLGALGEGGAVTTDDSAVADKVRMLREHGSVIKYYHPIEGYNGRLDALQAGFLSTKLPLLRSWNEERRRHAQYYNQILAQIPGLTTPFEHEWSRANYHLYIIQTDHRDALQQYLKEQGIGTGLHYPLPLHLQEAYRYLNYRKNDFPVAEAAAGRILSLPMFPSLKMEQQDRVATAIKTFFATHSDTV